MLWTYFAAVLALVAVVLSQGDSPTVKISLGTLMGKTETVTRGNAIHTVTEYLGIPFAQPPLGKLRFKNPEHVMSLGDDPYDATYYRPYCVQMEVGTFPPESGVEDEDCLYLNVFLPDGTPDETSGHAVMVWIYGGGFNSGASDMYHAAHLAAAGNVIVVTINYRLGPLGLLSTMNDDAPGNYALFDQHMALEWVHNNIESFGGDKYRVTIFGESAGAMSVAIQGLYEKNQGYFQRIIAQSGTATMQIINYDANTLPGAHILANSLNCNTEDNLQMLDCLRDVSWKDLQTTYLTLAADPMSATVVQFQPRTDGNFLKMDPRDLSEMMWSGRMSEELKFFQSFDFMTGVNAWEGGLFVNILHPNGEEMMPTKEEMMMMHIPIMAYLIYGIEFPEEIKKTVYHEYTNWTNPYAPESIRLQYTKALGDTIFVVPAAESSMLHMANGSGSTFVYHFIPMPSERFAWTPSWLPGADHGDELRMVFGMAYDNMEPWEQDLTDHIVTYWSNFAKSGDPNYPVTGKPTWKEYGHDQNYQALDRDTVHTKNNFGLRETNFWMDIVPSLLKANGGNNGGPTAQPCVAAAGTVVPILATLLSSVMCSLVYKWL